MARFALEGLDHVALAVRDVGASVQWYTTVLGLARMYQDAWGDSPAVVGAGNTAVALFPVQGSSPAPSPGRDVVAMRHVAFRTNGANFAMAQRALSDAGVAFSSQHHGISQSIYFRDPDGHEIEITTYEVGDSPPE